VMITQFPILLKFELNSVEMMNSEFDLQQMMVHVLSLMIDLMQQESVVLIRLLATS